MSDPASQKNSPYILLALLSVLVVSTLVVASLYFVGPNIKTTPETTVKEGVKEKVTTVDNIEKLDNVSSKTNDPKKEAATNELVVQADKIESKEIQPAKVTEEPLVQKDVVEPIKLEPVKKEKVAEVKAEVTTEAQVEAKPKDECDVRFTGNQLLVKNTKQ